MVETELRELHELIKSCRLCPLWRKRKNAVPGEGSLNPRVFFIGEAPGESEDLAGKPFVGKAGKVLDELLASVGLKRSEVFITNVVKCRPPGNREPSEEEIRACSPYLERQLSLLRPKVIATLGRVALAWCCKHFGLKDMRISKVHGRVFDVKASYGNAKLVALYHPAVAVYNPGMKVTLLQDFRILKSLV